MLGAIKFIKLLSVFGSVCRLFNECFDYRDHLTTYRLGGNLTTVSTTGLFKDLWTTVVI
jgi:hypothetical protein